MWIVDTILGIAKDGIGFFRDKQKAKFQLKMAGLQNRARLLLDTESNNHEWEMKALETSGKGLKWFSFSMFSLPIIITVVDPNYGKEIFANLALVPEWFMQTWVTINGAVWGVAALKDSGITFSSIGKVVSSLKKDRVYVGE